MNIEQAQQFGQLRARIEATFPTSSLLVITSAARGDGKTVTAYGLAESLAQADHRVLFVDANAEAPSLARIHRVPMTAGRLNVTEISQHALPVASQRFDGISFADQHFESGMSMDTIRAAAANMRAHFDYVIVDTSRLGSSDLAVLFAAVADATLLTVRLGRLPSSADQETIVTLTRVRATVVGVLTVSPSTIKSFIAARQDVVPTLRIPARHVTSRHSAGPSRALDVIETSRSNITS